MAVLETLYNYRRISRNFSNDPEIFDWKFDSYARTAEEQDEFLFTEISQHLSDSVIREFLINNVHHQINFNVDNFLIKNTDILLIKVYYQLNILGWNKLKINEPESFRGI